MLNRVILMGRISQDLVLKQTPGGSAVLQFNVAVDRSFVKQGEERQADFITCVAWNKNAEFIAKYFAKGRMIAIEGNLRTRNYDDKNGVKHYVTEVYVDSASFTGEARKEGGYERSYQQSVPAPRSDSRASEGSNVSIGSLSDFEDVIKDDDAPF